MLTFKYNLDRSSKKFICPGCSKKTFVRYVDNEAGFYLNECFGRCDRESKCNYHYAPPKGKKCYLMTFIHVTSISDKAIRAIESNGNLYAIPKSQVLERNGNSCWITEWWLKANNIAYLENTSQYFPPDEQMVNTVVADATVNNQPEIFSYHNLSLLDHMYNEQPVRDNFLKFLKSLFTENEVFTAMQNYFLTGANLCWNNATVFWQIDHKERIHAGKIMLYNPCTGKRIKKPYNHINWVHNALKEQDFNLSQCLFGLHRIREDFSSPIAIVESEKTAVIMSIMIPNVLWLASGSKQNLKQPLLEPLVGRKIVLYPDKGEYEDWKSKAERIKKSGLKVEVSDILEEALLQPGSDLVDFYLFKFKEDERNA